MGAQFRSRFVFKLLVGTVLPNKSLMWFYNRLCGSYHGKGSMNGVGGTVKNVVFRKVNSGQVVINFPQEFSQAVKSFVPSINAFYLPESESNAVYQAKRHQCAKKIKDSLKLRKLERKGNANGNLYINFFKIEDDGEPIHV